jgi:hypothetical protein
MNSWWGALKRILPGVAGLTVLLCAAGFIQHSLLPPGIAFHPLVESNDEIETPRQPGTTGVVIDLPQEPADLFCVNRFSSFFDFSELSDIDSKANVYITGEIRNDGRLFVTEINSTDHPEAGTFLYEKIKTWSFNPLKTGKITYFFNLASHAQLLHITTKLTRPEDKKTMNIKEGRLYAIDNLDAKLVKIERLAE